MTLTQRLLHSETHTHIMTLRLHIMTLSIATLSIKHKDTQYYDTHHFYTHHNNKKMPHSITTLSIMVLDSHTE